MFKRIDHIELTPGDIEKTTRAGSMLIELLLVFAVIAFIVIKVLGSYHKPSLNKETQKVMSGQGIDTTSYGAIKSSINTKLKDIQAKHLDDLDRAGAQ